MNNILLIQLRQLGDILLTTPCIREVRRAYPDARISFLSHPMGRLVLDENPHIDEIFYLDETMSLGEKWQLAGTIRRRKYDAVVDFMNNPRSALYTLLSGASLRVGFRSKRFFAYNRCHTLEGPADYIVREKFQLLSYLGIEPRSERLDLPWSEIHVGPLMKVCGEHPEFQASKLRIALSPTHRRPARRWPVENYVKLADHLVSACGASVLWLWGPHERDFVREIQSQCRESTQMGPETSFAELAALLGNCDGFIGNSNGPSHVAVAAGVSSLQLHGPTRGISWCPDNGAHRYVQCPEGYPGSMDNITFEMVLKKLDQVMPIFAKRGQKRSEAGLLIRGSQSQEITEGLTS